MSGPAGSVDDKLDSCVPGTLRLSGQRWTALDGNSQPPLSDATGELSPKAFGCIEKKEDACTMMRVARRNRKSRPRGATLHGWKTIGTHFSALRYRASYSRQRPGTKCKVYL